MEIQSFCNSADLKVAESLVVETPILLEKSLLFLLLQVECLSEVNNGFQNSVITDQRFPKSELNKVKEPDAENNDAGEAANEDDDSEDSEDDSDDDEDDRSESEEESDDDEEDSDDEVEAKGDGESDDDDEDEESDDDDDDEEEDDDDDDDLDEEEEDNKLPWTRKK